MSFTSLESLNDVDDFSNMTFSALFEMKSNAMLYLINTADVPRIKEMYNPNKRAFYKVVSFDEEIEDIIQPAVSYNIITTIDQSFQFKDVKNELVTFGKKLIDGMNQMKEVPLDHRKDIDYNVLYSIAFHKILEYLNGDEKTQEAIMMNGFDHHLIDTIQSVQWSVDVNTPLIELDDEQDIGDSDPTPTDKIEAKPL